jgi:hypothetical protein
LQFIAVPTLINREISPRVSRWSNRSDDFAFKSFQRFQWFQSFSEQERSSRHWVLKYDQLRHRRAE